MNSEKSKPQPSNMHNDFSLDLLDTKRNCRALLALIDPAARWGKITFLQTNYTDTEQKERRLDKVIRAEVLDGQGRVIGGRIYLIEFKSDIRMLALFLQMLTYLSILLRKYRLPVTPVVIYTGKRRLRRRGLVYFRDYLRRDNPTMHEHDLDFPIQLLNLIVLDIAKLPKKAAPIVPWLYLAPRIFDLTDEVIAEFYRLCLQLPKAQRKIQVAKGCIFMAKYGIGLGRQVRVE